MGGCQTTSAVDVRPYARPNRVIPRLSTESVQSTHSVSGLQSTTKVLDDIVADINQGKLKLHDFRSRLTDNNVKLERLLEPTLLNHPLFEMLKKSLASILDKWNTTEGRLLDEPDQLTFRHVAVFFSDIAEHFGSHTTSIIYQPFLLSLSFVKSMQQCLDKMANTGARLIDTADEYSLESFSYLLNVFRNFETKSSQSIDEIKSIFPLLLSVSSVIRSRYYTEIFLSLAADATDFTIVQRFLLDKCPAFVNAYKGKHSSDIHDTLLEQMFDRHVQILEHFLPHTEVWKAPVIAAITHIIDTQVNASFAAQSHVLQQPKLIEHALTILRSPRLSGKLSAKDMTPETWLINSILTGLHNMIYDSKLLAIIKSKTVTPVFVQIAKSAAYDRIQIHTYLILAGILNEAEIRELGNGKEITTVFLRYLTNAMASRQKMFKGVTLLAMLCGLKNLVQHDEVKSAILVQDANLSLLSKIIFQTKEQELAHALSILWTLSFNQAVADTIRKNAELMSRLELLATKSKQDESSNQNKDTSDKTTNGSSNASLLQSAQINDVISSAAAGILWQVRGETASSERQNAEKRSDTLVNDSGTPQLPDGESSKKKYDVMISYSHEDRVLCHKIADSLVGDGFSVWIDKNNMTGSTPVAIAHGIENSDIVLIGMTYSYKVSPWCQREGSYAFQRQTKIIPLKLPPAYRADGWLGLLVASLNYINFAKSDFDVAYAQLKAEIRNYQTQEENGDDRPSLRALHRQPTGEHSTKMPVDDGDYVYPPQSDGLYATIPIPSWTQQHVRDFLNDKRLYPILLLCKNMDGPALQQLYQFCIDNSTVAFESLQKKLEKKFNNYDLSPVEYTQFISEIKKLS